MGTCASDDQTNSSEEFVLDPFKASQLLKDSPLQYGDHKELVLQALSCSDSCLDLVSENLRNDQDVVRAASRHNPYTFQYASDELKDDDAFVREMMEQYSCDRVLSCVSHRLRDDKEFMLATVEYSGRSLQYASERLKNDKDVAIIAVTQSGYALGDASVELQDNKEVVLVAVRHIGNALEYASARLRNDEEVVFEAVQNDEYSLRHAADELKSCMAFLCAVFRHSKHIAFQLMEEKYQLASIIFQQASGELRDDKYFVLRTIMSHEATHTIFQQLSPRLQRDRDILRNSIHFDSTLQFASEDLRGDKDFMLLAVELCGSTLQYASEMLRGDKDLMLVCVKECGNTLQYASRMLQGDKDIVIAAVSQCGKSLQFASEELRHDKEVVHAAVKQWGCALEHASEELRDEVEVVHAAIRNELRSIKYASKRVESLVVLAAVRKSGFALEHISVELQDNKEIVLEAVQRNGNALRFASPRLQNDKEVVLSAIRKYKYALEYASDELKSSLNFFYAIFVEFDDIGRTLFQRYTHRTIREKVGAFQRLCLKGSFRSLDSLDVSALAEYVDSKFTLRTAFLHLLHWSSFSSHVDHAHVKNAMHECSELIAQYVGVPVKMELTDLLLAQEVLPLAIAYAGDSRLRKDSIIACTFIL